MTFVSIFSIFFGWLTFHAPFLLLSQDRAMDTGGSGTPPPRPPPCCPRPPTAPSTSPSCPSGSTGPTVRDSILVIRRSVLSMNPFLFIRGLSCPGCIQTWLSLNCLKLTILGFPHNCLLVSKKNPRSSISLEISPQSAFSPFSALLPSANHSAEWSGWVWPPSADSNGLLVHHYCKQRAVTPYPVNLNSNKKGAILP